MQRVILLLDSSRGFGRGLLAGFSRYSAVNGRWSFYYRQPSYLGKRRRLDLKELQNWKPDGVVCAYSRADELSRLGVPMVCYDPGNYEGTLPCITSDDDRIGQLAAEHLIGKGHRIFAFTGFGALRWSENRERRFRATVEAAGYPLHSLPHPKRPKNWSKEEPLIRDWLRTIPKPIAMFCANDDRAVVIAEMCLSLGLSIPEDVSILGADNDEILCEVGNPPLSSVRIVADQAGYDAAALLAKLMAGEVSMAGQRISAKAPDVVTRQSTNVLKVKDPHVRKAIQCVQANISRPIQVSEIVREAGRSHRALNNLFRAEVGTSIGQYLTAARVSHICYLLVDSDMQVQEVAAAVGYDDDRHFSRYFKRSTGMTPNAYRRKMRAP